MYEYVFMVEVLGDRMFQVKGTVNTEEKGRSFEKEQEADWGQNKVCRDLWKKPCQPSLPGGVICVCAQLIFPQDMTWPGLWTAASSSSS